MNNVKVVVDEDELLIVEPEGERMREIICVRIGEGILILSVL